MSLRPIQVSPAELSQLIALIYAGAEDARRWEDCLERLRTLVHAHTANFLFAAWEDHASSVALSVGQASEGVKAYNEHWQRHDVLLRSGAPELEQSGRIYGSQALASDATVKSSAIYNEFYRDLGIFHALLSTVVAEPRRTVLLSVNYSYAEGPPDAGRHELFALLTPHFQRAVTLYERLHRREARAAGFQEFLNSSPVGFALLRGDGRLLLANRAFDVIAAAEDGLRRKQDRLVAGDSDADSALARAIREATAASERRGTLPGGSLRVPRPSGRRAYELTVCPVSDEGSLFDLDRARAVLLLADPDAEPPGLPETLQAEWRLTPREAMLTARLLAGAEPAALADELGVTRHTLTFHLKRIYRKTGVSGRAELMRALSRGLAGWARPQPE